MDKNFKKLKLDVKDKRVNMYVEETKKRVKEIPMHVLRQENKKNKPNVENTLLYCVINQDLKKMAKERESRKHN
jgi:hypothetical protein